MMSSVLCPTHYTIFILISIVLKLLVINCHTIGPADEEKEISVFINVLIYKPTEIPIGSNVTIMCRTTMAESTLDWIFGSKNITEQEGFLLEKEGENIEESGKKYEVSILHILNIDFHHTGEYTCLSFTKDQKLDIARQILNITMTPRILSMTSPMHTKMTKTIKLHCTIQGYPIDEIAWFKNGQMLERDSWKVESLNQTVKNTTLEISSVSKNDNGTYMCFASTNVESTNRTTMILVLDKPLINIDFIKSIGIGKIFLNWTVNDGNDAKHLTYRIQYKSAEDSTWFYYPDKVEGINRSYILKSNFKNDTEYTVRIMASNQEGESQYSVSKPVAMLSEEPIFVPDVKVTGVTVSSITIKWSDPPSKFVDLIHYYLLISKSSNSSTKETIQPASRDSLYMFSDLKPATTYVFQVAACSDYTNTCGPSSEIVNGTTMDGISGPPSDAVIECRFDNISQTGFVSVSWKPPKEPHGTIMSYNVNVDGSAIFYNEQGNMEHITWGPKVTSVSENTLNTRFYNVSANTNYTVRISGVTRTKRNGQDVELKCSMPPTLPDKQKLSRFTWRKIEEQLGQYIIKLNIPRISERKGPICCYRIYLVRMESQQKLAELPEPEDLLIVSYQEAHRTPKGGAYVAEMFDNTVFHPEVFLGDDQVYNFSGSECDKCIGLRPYSTPRKVATSASNVTSNTTSNETVERVRRNDLVDPLPPYDGILDVDSNYTGFIEILVHGPGYGTLAAYSSYFAMINPGPDVVIVPVTNSFPLVVKTLCALLLIIFLLLFALIRRYTKQAHAQAVEMITFRTSLRSLRGRQRLVSLNPPDMCPIVKRDLLSAYIERHRDSDYGFQQEFELLPDRFSDRTTRASDSRDNVYKNRYPDIKAYDQTRVKLSQVDSIAGSDYINANYVLSYRERKKFICAQGPMDTTVNDFWRMIWEQHLELILMLTNLEEYSKTKCAKYWPDKVDDEKTFGDITVTHLDEIRYSDYLVRNLKICRKNGVKEEERRITQYHYLVWKDFMAPEHPNGIIKFIKRMNEVYSIEKGCILVHCSAGVGRTGTLVALDCLLQQLKEEGQVSIFNTICDLRHQRNFLVQSLKQYIFIYRALMEVAQHGDQEINADELKTTIEKAKKCDLGESKCKLEEQFENIINAFEDRKSTSVALTEENRDKNRSEQVVPYDRNRVILTPLPGREHSTYINATFIEGYDNNESFIITQDPMENTVNDFWRMVSEQGISVIVMLSELGEGKCPRYWPEDESCYDHIMVRYVQAESCPYYTRREMYVKSRDGEETKVTHLQYHGWPTVDGEVPEVTRGLIELVDHSQTSLVPSGCSPSMVVHCNLGTIRSSMFVGLCILVEQLRTEGRVDIFTLTRKLRSQRLELLNTYAQYEFLHRAIVNYAELHGLCKT
ncbi:tyrosine-protein phosphatase 69D [Coccinella septempunctata]|uniref:tyrosine-protein phosphatase 69D n=1 Tax=Coccinella septempunctata TaxID=41139 RepID=UPI001D0792E0|nr:tyrosine-protein phosphatase 69D [Coccinella septempunctata]